MHGSSLQAAPCHHHAQSPPTPPSPKPADLHRLARRLFPRGSLTVRALQHYRPYICPFELLLPHVPPGARVLDAGCGGGLWLGLLAATGRMGEGVGFDSSESAIRVAQQMRVPEGYESRLTFQYLRVQEPWPEGAFEVVSLIDVLHHVPPDQQSRVIASAAERVATGGVLIYKDMCSRPVWRAWANRAHDLVVAHQWINYAPVEQVSLWAVNAGLTLIHAASVPRLWYGHELRVFRKG